MSRVSAAKKHLRLLDTETGEVTEFACAHCKGKEDELVELTRKMRGLARELGELRRDRDTEAREHEAWPMLLGLFGYWQELTGHTRARWEQGRFWLALPLWKIFGTGNIAAAIAGLAYDANSKPLKNGKIEVYDSWELLFRNAGTLERYMKRRPKSWELPERFADDIPTA
jgi:hypothetical protein